MEHKHSRGKRSMMRMDHKYSRGKRSDVRRVVRGMRRY